MDGNNGGKFQFSYSAAERAEVERIRKKYQPRDDNKLEQIKRLDSAVTQKSTMYSIIIGVVGALLLGIGMCCTLVWGALTFVFALGIVIGIIGIGVLALAYPVYIYIEKKERERIAPEILRLTDELLK